MIKPNGFNLSLLQPKQPRRLNRRLTEILSTCNKFVRHVAEPTKSKPGAFLSAAWRYLAMLNFEIDPAILQPLVPQGTELDTWEGRTFISLVGFRFLNTRLWGVPIPFHRNFDDINLRFYARRRATDGWRRGVVFIKEVVPRRAIAAVARWVYNENYVACRTRSRIALPDLQTGAPGSVEYRWRSRVGEHVMRAQFVGEPRPLIGSQERFIAEHYWAFVTQRDGSTLEYRVAHRPWRVWTAHDAELSGDVARFYGPEYADVLGDPPTSAFVAEGSPVTVHRGRRLGVGRDVS